MADYISSNPSIIVNGFIKSGISTFLSNIEDEADSDNEADDDYSDNTDYSDDDCCNDGEQYEDDLDDV